MTTKKEKQKESVEDIFGKDEQMAEILEDLAARREFLKDVDYSKIIAFYQKFVDANEFNGDEGRELSDELEKELDKVLSLDESEVIIGKFLQKHKLTNIDSFVPPKKKKLTKKTESNSKKNEKEKKKDNNNLKL